VLLRVFLEAKKISGKTGTDSVVGFGSLEFLGTTNF